MVRISLKQVAEVKRCELQETHGGETNCSLANIVVSGLSLWPFDGFW